MDDLLSFPLPVILDTDPGDDIDDTWALVMLLNSPELELKLVVTSNGNTKKRAQIVAKLLTIAGRTDVDIGIGRSTGGGGGTFMKQGPGSQYEWAKDFNLESYKGVVHKDGITAMQNLIEEHNNISQPPITLLSIAPCHNIGDLLKRNPEIATNCNYVGMQGSITKSMRLEYNIATDVEAAKRVFNANWKSMTITPLDTCGLVELDGKRYETVVKASEGGEKPLVKAMIDLTEAWASGMPGSVRARMLRESPGVVGSPLIKSSTLFDCAAIYLAFSTKYINMEEKIIVINNVGRTIVEKEEKREEGNEKRGCKKGCINCALSWKDIDAFHDLLVDRVTRS